MSEKGIEVNDSGCGGIDRPDASISAGMASESSPQM
jgi:hypothetical protein